MHSSTSYNKEIIWKNVLFGNTLYLKSKSVNIKAVCTISFNVLIQWEEHNVSVVLLKGWTQSQNQAVFTAPWKEGI